MLKQKKVMNLKVYDQSGYDLWKKTVATISSSQLMHGSHLIRNQYERCLFLFSHWRTDLGHSYWIKMFQINYFNTFMTSDY